MYTIHQMLGWLGIYDRLLHTWMWRRRDSCHDGSSICRSKLIRGFLLSQLWYSSCISHSPHEQESLRMLPLPTTVSQDSHTCGPRLASICSASGMIVPGWCWLEYIVPRCKNVVCSYAPVYNMNIRHLITLAQRLLGPSDQWLLRF